MQRERTFYCLQVGESIVECLEGGMKLTCQSFAISLSCIEKDEETPLLEIATLKLKASLQSKDASIVLQLEGESLANVFNNIKVGWEPVMDRWPVKLEVASNRDG